MLFRSLGICPFHSVIFESNLNNNRNLGEFPGGPVVRTQHFHCRGPGSIPSRETKILQAAWRGQKKKKKNYTVRLCTQAALLWNPRDS